MLSSDGPMVAYHGLRLAGSIRLAEMARPSGYGPAFTVWAPSRMAAAQRDAPIGGEDHCLNHVPCALNVIFGPAAPTGH
jgi:hypothetical protein